ncbi:MAG: preprotein translocase subunit SecA [Deltaproteobacteria bacterium]|nr:preprotein translocase subunit SecA [Deltaproteobacteria bacterium]
MSNVFTRLFGSKNEREVRRMLPRVQAINALEPKLQKLTDDELKAKTGEFRQKLDNGASLDDLLVEAFAVGREAGRRILRMRHFDVQLIGGMVLHSGRVAEMRTGEGKTLVATLPAYLNALSGKGVHVVTVNDYLANRDAEWMGKIYRFLGLDVGVIVNGFGDAHKRKQYAADITYGTNSELGFDYLRDNMKMFLSEYVQGRGLNYGIVDEVDSVLIDEARTPLIISGQAEESTERYIQVNEMVSKLHVERDYTIDEKSKSAVLTDEGTDRVEKMLKVGNLYVPDNIMWLHHVSKALQAHACYKRDVDYLVKEGEVLIIDEHTGRTMQGRRWSDGLHQAIEAKEGVKIQRESMTLATITYQNLYRMYSKLSGMTGTADTEAEELGKIYKLDVVVIPTNKRMIRTDAEDMVYKTEREKFDAVIADIKTRHERGQPVLVGTKSVDKSDVLARLLKKHGLPHTVLNAKFHRAEGEIIAQAGALGAITISTNMAGRGTDILLGGNPEYLARADVAQMEAGEFKDQEREQKILAEFRWLAGSPESVPVATVTNDYVDKILRPKIEAARASGEPMDVAELRRQATEEAREYVQKMVKAYGEHLETRTNECEEAKKKVLAAGGLHVLGTERHESRRVDNQLRGRAGRQGDPGTSQFYLSLEDDLMRMFGGDKLLVLMDRMGMEDGVPIESRMVSRSIEGAQKRVEGHNFDIRKNLIEYDDVMNQQRKAIYGLRRKVLGVEDMTEEVLDMIERVVAYNVDTYCSKKDLPDEWNLKMLHDRCKVFFGIDFDFLLDESAAREHRSDDIGERIYEAAEKKYLEKNQKMEDDWAVVDDQLIPKAEIPLTAKEQETVSRYILRQVYLEEIDVHWRDHLTRMDQLKEGIHLRGYGQRDPKIEYKREGFVLYQSTMREIDHNVVTKLFHGQLMTVDEWNRRQDIMRRQAELMMRQAELQRAAAQNAQSADAVASEEAEQAEATARAEEGGHAAAVIGPALTEAQKRRIGRNDPCWCGSGKKYKKCHLESDEQRASAG